jgi:hypothetical protein
MLVRTKIQVVREGFARAFNSRRQWAYVSKSIAIAACQEWHQPPMAFLMEICYHTVGTPTLKCNLIPSNESLQTRKYTELNLVFSIKNRSSPKVEINYKEPKIAKNSK